LGLSDKTFKKIEEEVNEKECDAIDLLFMDDKKSDIPSISKSTDIPTRRLRKWGEWSMSPS